MASNAFCLVLVLSGQGVCKISFCVGNVVAVAHAWESNLVLVTSYWWISIITVVVVSYFLNIWCLVIVFPSLMIYMPADWRHDRILKYELGLCIRKRIGYLESGTWSVFFIMRLGLNIWLFITIPSHTWSRRVLIGSIGTTKIMGSFWSTMSWKSHRKWLVDMWCDNKYFEAVFFWL